MCSCTYIDSLFTVIPTAFQIYCVFMNTLGTQPKVSSGKFTLDGVEMIDRLRGLGAAYGREALPLFEKYFLYGKAEPFSQFAATPG